MKNATIVIWKMETAAHQLVLQSQDSHVWQLVAKIQDLSALISAETELLQEQRNAMIKTMFPMMAAIIA